MLKVAIVGCGKIADEHASQIQRARGATLVAVCDAEPLMGRQMTDRFGGTAYRDLASLLAAERPDVVHITTPPTSHFGLAMQCIDAGSHLFIEKPFTMTAGEAVTLLDAATARGVKVTVDHNLQFTTPAIKLRELVDAGFLGGAPVHLESYYCYDLSDPGYARAFLSDSRHWVRALPGGLLQNIISHGIARLSPYLRADHPEVTACGFTSPLLQSLGEHHLRDELRVIIRDGSTSAYFTFSSQMRPQVSELRVFGPRNGLLLDDDRHVVIPLGGARQKSYLQAILPALRLSSHYTRQATANVRDLLTGRMNMNEGMRELIHRFYRSVADGEPVPIPYREIILTARIMDDIFAQLADMPAHASAATIEAALTR